MAGRYVEVDVGDLGVFGVDCSDVASLIYDKLFWGEDEEEEEELEESYGAGVVIHLDGEAGEISGVEVWGELSSEEWRIASKFMDRLEKELADGDLEGFAGFAEKFARRYGVDVAGIYGGGGCFILLFPAPEEEEAEEEEEEEEE
ncbi:hypothetical protein [Stetteria hydrogenophila]